MASVNRGRRRPSCRLKALVALVSLALATLAAAGPAMAQSPAGPVVMIDPGHGGKDTGARGPSGTLEKDVCLTLAQDLRAQMTAFSNPRLTRSDDYDIDVIQRTAMANHDGAGMLVSLHAGAGFRHQEKGIVIYYYQPVAPPAGVQRPGVVGPMPDPSGQWRRAQMPYVSESKALAYAIREQFARSGLFPESQVKGAPLLVLEGATMPAVVIEFGYLTHPETEKTFNSADQLKVYARTIRFGLEAYLKRRP